MTDTDLKREVIREAMRLLGQRTSRRKARAARANGRKGGRPRKDKHERNNSAAIQAP